MSHAAKHLSAVLCLSLAAFVCAGAARAGAVAEPPSAGTWVRPGPGDDRPVWGFRRGIQVALYPIDVEGPGDGGPRGLLRICYPMLAGGKRVGLVNYMAVEPVVGRKRGYSEMDQGVDGKQGRPFWTGTPEKPGASPDPGRISREGGLERLAVTLYIERFAIGAHPIMEMEFRGDRPDEVRFTVHSAPDSAPMDYCVLTATMGNYERLRRLWLRGGVQTPSSLWPGFAGRGFTSQAFFPLERLPRMRSGDVLVCAQTDEKDPSSAREDPRAEGWNYRGSFTLTQYWRKPKGTWRDDVQARVNGRRIYWGTEVELPGGLAFENFDMLERFHEGQVFVFGLTRKTPKELGVSG
jgi:hypothetical protein